MQEREMTAKEWLSRGWMLQQQIDSLEEEKRKALDIAIRSVRQSGGERVQTSGGNSSEAKMAVYAHYSAKLKERVDELLVTKEEILEAILQVENATLRTLLQLRYINFYTWERIAEEIDMSDFWVRTSLHNKALAAIDQIREKI